MDFSLLDSFVHGISEARTLEWVAVSFSMGSSQPKDQISVSSGLFTVESPATDILLCTIKELL